MNIAGITDSRENFLMSRLILDTQTLEHRINLEESSIPVSAFAGSIESLKSNRCFPLTIASALRILKTNNKSRPGGRRGLSLSQTLQTEDKGPNTCVLRSIFVDISLLSWLHQNRVKY
jgi:hypothetical protein